MRLPLRLSPQGPVHRLLAVGFIAFAASGAAIAARHTPYVSIPLSKIDDLLYDSFYRLRPLEDRTAGPIVIIAVDERSLDELENRTIANQYIGWPWYRELWGNMVGYLGRCGAKAIVFDLLFTKPSVYQATGGDDEKFAKDVDASKVPVVLATLLTNGGPDRLAPPVRRARIASSVVTDERVYRRYTPIAHGVPSLAFDAATVVTGDSSPSMVQPFLLHYYGPHQSADGRRTFRYLSASRVVAASYGSKDSGISPDMFRDKIVLVGGIAAALYDLVSSPLSDLYPGVEVHATAIENLLRHQFVHEVPAPWAATAVFLCAFLAAAGVVWPGRTWLKLSAAGMTVAALFAAAILLFRGQRIYWLPMAAPLVAFAIATVGAFAWSYFAEGRQRRMVVRTLAQSLSPAVVEHIERNPDVLKQLGGQRRVMSVMFTDIADFTKMSEKMEGDQLTRLMNFYLEEMSAVVIAANAYLDKYIGDAIMSFWNHLVEQPDHAVRACRAALGVERREREIQDELRRLGAPGLRTRIGINTGPMTLGNMGSSFKLAYTVLGDSVNLASRLEGANKLYGSHILVAHETAELVKHQFVLRQLDLLRVTGKQQPMAVYELMTDTEPDANLRLRVRDYEDALRLHQQQNWDEAECRLRALRDRFPEDAPVAALIERIAYLREHPPGPDWDGVYVAKGK